MPDIAMCQNENCPSAGTCYRFNAKPSEPWQSFTAFQVPAGADRCEDFLIWYSRDIHDIQPTGNTAHQWRAKHKGKQP